MDLTTVSSHRLARRREDLLLGAGETLLAGGTWLFSEPQPATTGLVDLTTLGWPDLEELPDGSLRIAATCPVAVLRERGGVFAWCADALLMSPKVQAVATVGGNVCLGLPAGAACLVRPDQYVAARWMQPDRDRIGAALSRANGGTPWPN